MGIKGIIASVVSFIAAVTVVVVAWGSFYTIDEGKRGIVKQYGKVVEIADAGLHWKTPFVQTVQEVSVQDHTFRIPDLITYSFDQQPAAMNVSVTYRVPADKVGQMYASYGTRENMQTRLIERKAFDIIKNVFGKFTATRSVQEREKLSAEVLRTLQESVAGQPVEIVGVQLEGVSFSKAYEATIEERMKAQVQIETTRQQEQTAEVQANIRVIQAKAEADSQREKARAAADGIKMMGEAEAEAIEARGKALAANRGLVELVAAEKWNGVLPTSMVPSGAVPFINVK